MRKVLVSILGLATIGFLAYVFYYQYGLITRDAEIAEEQNKTNRAVEEIKREVIEGEKIPEDAKETKESEETGDSEEPKDSAFLADIRSLTEELTKALTFEKKPSEEKAKLARNALVKFFDSRLANSNPTERERDEFILIKSRLKPKFTEWIRSQAHNVIYNEKSYKETLNSGNEEAIEVKKIQYKREKQRIESERKSRLDDILNLIQKTNFNSSSEIITTFRSISNRIHSFDSIKPVADPDFTPRPKKIVSLKFKPEIKEGVAAYGYKRPNHSKAQYWKDAEYVSGLFKVETTSDSLTVKEQDGAWFKVEVGMADGGWVHGDFFIPTWEEVRD